MATKKKLKNNFPSDSCGVWNLPKIFVHDNIFFDETISITSKSQPLSDSLITEKGIYCLHINKKKQMCKHWCKTFLTFLSSFDSQVPQGHCYNLTIPRVSSTLAVLPILPITIESLSSTLFFTHTEIMFHPLLQQGMWNDTLKPTCGVMNTVSSFTLASTAGKLESNVPHRVSGW